LIKEHAITYKEKISLEQLEYLVKKGVKLGASGKAITRVSADEDSEGIHIYLDVVGYADNNT